MTTTFTVPIVGAHFRPPAKQVLTVLPLGIPLTLEPEPDNAYDEFAIKVLVQMNQYPIAQWAQLVEALNGTGYDAHELCASHEPLHLGYVPASGGKTAKGGPGNREITNAFGQLDSSEPRPYTASLGNALEGYPTITIVIEPSAQKEI